MAQNLIIIGNGNNVNPSPNDKKPDKWKRFFELVKEICSCLISLVPLFVKLMDSVNE